MTFERIHPSLVGSALSMAMSSHSSSLYIRTATMTKFTAALFASLVASSAAFVQKPAQSASSALQATGFEEVGGKPFDPLNLAKLGTGESFDTFPNMFPDVQFLKEAEIKLPVFINV